MSAPVRGPHGSGMGAAHLEWEGIEPTWLGTYLLDRLLDELRHDIFKRDLSGSGTVRVLWSRRTLEVGLRAEFATGEVSMVVANAGPGLFPPGLPVGPAVPAGMVPVGNPSHVGEAGFDSPRFALGMVRGVRAFGLTQGGWLTGATYCVRWLPGVNRARCLKGVPTMTIFDGEQALHAGHITSAPTAAGAETGVDVIEAGHRLKGCTCGFWAYWGLTNNYSGLTKVTGVIEAFGRTVLGDRGFRSAMARVVAVLEPDVLELSEKYGPHATIAKLPAAYARLRENYPDVKVYRDQASLLRDFPPDYSVGAQVGLEDSLGGDS